MYFPPSNKAKMSRCSDKAMMIVPYDSEGFFEQKFRLSRLYCYENLLKSSIIIGSNNFPNNRPEKNNNEISMSHLLQCGFFNISVTKSTSVSISIQSGFDSLSIKVLPKIMFPRESGNNHKVIEALKAY